MNFGNVISGFVSGMSKAEEEEKDRRKELQRKELNEYKKWEARQNSVRGMFTGNTAGELSSGQAQEGSNVYPDSVKLEHEYLKSKEGKKNTYNTKNEAGSSAYGKYQFMPSTAKEIAKSINIDPDQWTTPENQELIMSQAKKDYSNTLNRWGIEDTDENQYAIHQLGSGRAKRYFSGSLTKNDYKVMNDNLPADLKSDNFATILANWSNTY